MTTDPANRTWLHGSDVIGIPELVDTKAGLRAAGAHDGSSLSRYSSGPFGGDLDGPGKRRPVLRAAPAGQASISFLDTDGGAVRRTAVTDRAASEVKDFLIWDGDQSPTLARL